MTKWLNTSFWNFVARTLLRNSIGEDNKMLKYVSLVLKLSNLKKDFFRLINCPFSGDFVSERLKEAIEKEGFQSMRFEEIDSRIKIV